MAQLDFDFAVGNEVHRVRRLTASRNDCSSGDLLRAETPHDVGDMDSSQFAEQRNPSENAPGNDEVATVDFVRKGGCHDADRQRHHNQSDEY